MLHTISHNVGTLRTDELGGGGCQSKTSQSTVFITKKRHSSFFILHLVGPVKIEASASTNTNHVNQVQQSAILVNQPPSIMGIRTMLLNMSLKLACNFTRSFDIK